MTKSSLRSINNEEILNSNITLYNTTNADSQVRQTLENLGKGIAKVFSWGSSIEGTQTQVIAAPETNDNIFTDLSTHLNKTIYDVDAFGSVPELINSRIQEGLENASFLVTDLTKIVEQYDQWKRELPMVEPFYAMKCNPDPVIVRLLATLGCGFDCATMGEINLVLNDLGSELSFKPKDKHVENLIYANPSKFQSHLEFATQNGVRMVTFDGEDELYKLAKVNEELPEGKKLQLLLRITTHDSKSVCQFSKKFGCPAPDGHELLKIAHGLDLDVVGVSFHVGSGCGDVAAYTTALTEASVLFKKADELGMKPMTMIDIGGGFPGDNVGTYRSELPNFFEIAAAVRTSIAEFKEKFESSRPLRFIAEPGRYFVSRSTTIATKIYGRKGGNGQAQALYVDDGVYGSFNNVVYDHYHPVPRTLKEAVGQESNANTEKIPTAVFGPTCDGIDQMCDMKDTKLERAQIGDWLIFENMGAYTHTASFVFNGYTHIPTKVHCISDMGVEEDSSMSTEEDCARASRTKL